MMFKIVITTRDISLDMPHDIGLNLFDACYRADLYKKNNAKAAFTVVDMTTGDVEYQV